MTMEILIGLLISAGLLVVVLWLGPSIGL